MTRLYREEVLKARRTGWLDGIVLSQPPTLRLLMWLAVAATVVLVAFLMLASYTRRARVDGSLVPSQGLATLVAPVAGIVRELPVQEGARIGAGRPAAVIVVPRATLAGGSTHRALLDSLLERQATTRELQQAREAQLGVQRESLRRQIAQLRLSLAQAGEEVDTRSQQVRLAEEAEARARQLHAQKFLSVDEFRRQQAAVLAARVELQEARRSHSDIARDLDRQQLLLRELPAQHSASRATTSRELSELEGERIETAARGEYLVEAPITGVIANQSVKIGQSVEAGQPLLTILPNDGRLEAELLVPSRLIGFISPGDRVLLRYAAYPYQKFGHHVGRVTRITRSPLTARELRDREGVTGSLYRIVVGLERQTIIAYGRPEALKPGMELEAEILGERRRLVEWILDPLHSVKGRLE